MTWSDAGRNQRAAATAALVASVSMHTGDPGAAGTANEWTGGSPAYSRQTPSFTADGTGVQSAEVVFNGPANEPATHIGFWDGTDFIGSWVRTSGDAAANAEGEFTANIPITSNA